MLQLFRILSIFALFLSAYKASDTVSCVINPSFTER